jgi:hypothetical protein
MQAMPLDDRGFAELLDVRVHDPERIAKAHAARRRRTPVTRDGMLFVVAADHTARGVVGVGDDRRAMADRRSMLDRVLVALDHPRVDGVLGSGDVLDDLVVLGALEDKFVAGTMNRGGLAGARWEIDDRFTAYDAEHIVASNFDAGKMLLRIDDGDGGTASTLEACSRAVRDLNDQRVMAMVEPIPYTKDQSGRAVWDDDPDKLLRAVAVCAALGGGSAYTWLKVQATSDIAAVAATTTQPVLLLGGALGADPSAVFDAWAAGLEQPSVRGLVVGRAVLYPQDGDVAGAIDRAAVLVEAAAKSKAGA